MKKLTSLLLALLMIASLSLAVSANSDGNKWGELAEGRILIQDHSDSTVSFRNLKIREL